MEIGCLTGSRQYGLELEACFRTYTTLHEKLQSLGAKCQEPSSCSLALSKLTGTVRAIALCHTGIADCTSSVPPDEHCGGRLVPISERTATERDTIRVDYPDSSSRPSCGSVTLQDSDTCTPDDGPCMSGDSCFCVRELASRDSAFSASSAFPPALRIAVLAMASVSYALRYHPGRLSSNSLGPKNGCTGHASMYHAR